MAVLTINEIFHSIQGESTHAGRPCVFVRLTACDLRCRWCDTPYAFHEGRKMSVDEVVADVEARGCQTVEVTGGEPLLQPDVYPLMQRLLDSGKTVLIETGGHRSIAERAARRDPHHGREVPGLRRVGEERLEQPRAPHETDEVKFVIADRRDYEYREGDRASASNCRLASTPCCSRPSTASSIRNAVGMGHRRSARRARAAADAQIHLESETRGV